MPAFPAVLLWLSFALAIVGEGLRRHAVKVPSRWFGAPVPFVLPWMWGALACFAGSTLALAGAIGVLWRLWMEAR